MATATEELKPELSEKDVQELKTATALVLFGETEKDEDGKKAAAAKAAEEAKAKTDKEAADKKAKEDTAAAAAGKTAESQEAGKGAKMPTAAEIADGVAERMKPPAVKAPGPVELSEEDQLNRNVLEFMAKEQPDFGRLLKRFDAFIPAEKSYREKWEKENPGETYDPSATDHEEFYKANDPIQTEQDQEAFDRAQNRFEARQEADKTYSEREDKRLYNEAVKEVTGKLKTHDVDITKEMLAAVDPELAKIDLKKLKEKDPFAAIAMRPYAGSLIAMTAELEKAFTPNLNYQITAGNPLHDAIVHSIFEYEKELLALPAEEQLNDGRRLAPIEQYNKMSKADRDRHWTIWMEPKAVKALLVRDFSNKVREDLNVLRTAAGKPVIGSAASEPPKKVEPKPKDKPVDTKKKDFPNLSGGAGDGTSGVGAPVAASSDAKLITTALWPS